MSHGDDEPTVPHTVAMASADGTQASFWVFLCFWIVLT